MRKDVIGNQFNLISICGRISNMGEAINMLSFNIIFLSNSTAQNCILRRVSRASFVI